jgi:hypothetical protein
MAIASGLGDHLPIFGEPLLRAFLLGPPTQKHAASIKAEAASSSVRSKLPVLCIKGVGHEGADGLS